jgi:hypothetical protein
VPRIEAEKFLAAELTTDRSQTSIAHCSIDEALSAAPVVSAAVTSPETGMCREVAIVPGAWPGGLREGVRV